MSKITTQDGAAIHFQLEGNSNKPVLLFSNSLGTNLRSWDAQLKSFGDRYRILRYDSRGHGQSEAPPGPYSIERLGRDVIDLLDSLELEKVSFCGLSKGGMVGMWLGVNAPQRFNKIALGNTSAHLPPAKLWNERIEMARQGCMEEIVEGVIPRWFTANFLSAKPEEVARIRRQFVATSGEGYAACCEAIRDMDQRESIKSINAPTLVITGANDPVTPPDHGRFLAENIPGARYAEIPDAAHLSNIEQASRFNAALNHFLTD